MCAHDVTMLQLPIIFYICFNVFSTCLVFCFSLVSYLLMWIVIALLLRVICLQS